VTLTWPWGEHQHEPGVGDRLDGVALSGTEVRQESWPAGDALAVVGDLDLTVGHEQVRTLVNLMLL
jgi:hypothetical protein